jgi:hypothetical protein
MHHDGNHRLAVEAVTKAKNYPLKEYGEQTAAGPGTELVSEISAEDDFFTKAAACRGKYQPYQQLDYGLGRDIRLADIGACPQKMNQKPYQWNYDNEESDGDS